MSYFASIHTAGTIVARVIVPNIQIENSCECVCVYGDESCGREYA